MKTEQIEDATPAFVMIKKYVVKFIKHTKKNTNRNWTKNPNRNLKRTKNPIN